MQFPKTNIWLGIDKSNGVVYRSEDRGKSWNEVSDIRKGKAAYLFSHPFDKKMAFVLGESTEHYVTEDRGKSWRKFTTPLPPLQARGNPLRFHSERAKYILFSGERCEDDDRWFVPLTKCHEEIFYTLTAFKHDGDLENLMGEGNAVSQCRWARSTEEFKELAEQTIMCLESSDSDDNRHRRRSDVSLTWIKNSLNSHQDGLGTRDQPDEPLEQRQKRSLFDFGWLTGSMAKETRLVMSEDYFSTKRIIRFGGGNDGHSGDMAHGAVVGISVVKKFIIAAVQHGNSDEMDMFVSLDGHTWAESHLPLPPGVKEDAYTVLESTKHSLLVDVVLSSSKSYGTLFRSNSNGTYYVPSLEHTHRDQNGLVDLERVNGLEGVIIANQVSNWDKLGWEHGGFLQHAQLKSRISFDDGAHWRYLKAPKKDHSGKNYGCTEDGFHTGDCALHIHSVTSVHNPGSVYSTEASPGIVLAVGSVGPHLLPWNDCDTFLSTDGGLNWKAIHKDAHLYEFVDSGNTFMLINNEGPTDTITYSADRGETWHEIGLGVTIRAAATINDPLGIDEGLMIIGSVTKGDKRGQFIIISVNFEKVWSKKCSFDPKDPKENRDIESWVLKANQDNDCVMGHKAIHFRRKATAQCTISTTGIALPHIENCKCEGEDYECDYNYVLNDNGTCVLAGQEIVPSGSCLNEGDHFMGSSGYRLIPGDTCDYEKGMQLDKPTRKPCPKVFEPPSGGLVTHQSTTFRSEITIAQFANSTTYLLWKASGGLLRSPDQGTTWKDVDLTKLTSKSSAAVVFLYTHPYGAGRAYAYFSDESFIYTVDYGETWSKFNSLPDKVNGLGISPVLDFHPQHPDWLLYIASTKCPYCHTVVYMSKDHGKSWNKVTTHAEKCLFSHSRQFLALPEATIICSEWRDKKGTKNEQDRLMAEKPKDNPVQLMVYTNPTATDGSNKSWVLQTGENGHLLDFTLYSKFIIAIVITEISDDEAKTHSELRLHVSLDGKTSTVAQLPPNLPPMRQEGVTLVPGPADSDRIFIDLEQSSYSHINIDEGWGTLMASNSNGTYFHPILENTHRNAFGTVGVEAVEGMNGVWVANQVMNVDSMGRPGVRALVRTRMTWDGGRTWHLIKAPNKDSLGQDTGCVDCKLNLIDRAIQYRDGAMYGTSTVPGLLMSVGSIAPHLEKYEKSQTFLSNDGGRSWIEARRIETLNRFGDHGGLIVMISDEGPTNVLWYSYNHGKSWHTYQFTNGEKLRVQSLINGVHGGGSKFLILGRRVGADNRGRADETVIVSVDFTKLFKRKCVLNQDNHEQSDFEIWSSGPPNPRDQTCFNGEQVSYWRRKADADCYVGHDFRFPEPIRHICECTELDFECEAGFWPDDEGKCVLDGPDPYQPQNCPEGSTYTGRSGYVKRPASKCKGGMNLETKVKRICGKLGGAKTTANTFESEILDFQYFKHSSHLLTRFDNGEARISMDEGATWRLVPDPDNPEKHITDIVAVLRNPYFEDYAVFITAGNVHYLTDNEGRSVRKLHTPKSPTFFVGTSFQFHADQPEWMIYYAENKDCSTNIGGDCPSQAFITTDMGSRWESLMPEVGPSGCRFLLTDKLRKSKPRSVICQIPAGKNSRDKNPYNIIAVDDVFFKDRPKRTLLQGAMDYTIIDQHLIMARSVGDGKYLEMHISENGMDVAKAFFPGEKDRLDPAYTVLQPAETGGSLMLHVTKNMAFGKEWGSIYSSNSNGTYFRISLENVNRNDKGLVDFERIESLEGAALANVVSNAKSLSRRQLGGNEKKQLQTMMTMDNGASWHYLKSPIRDSNGHNYNCRTSAPSSGGCALHLHGYTELAEPENIYSGSGAPGIIIGLGNVGSSLGPLHEASTFVSRDGGHVWTEIQKGPYWHVIGDHGALLVLADRIHATDHVLYSTDDGVSWNTLALDLPGNQKINVEMLTSETQGTSRRFLLLGKLNGSDPKYTAVQIDLTGTQPRKCMFDPKDEASGRNLDDFELWSPRAMGRQGETREDQMCVLGHQVQYFRRIHGKECYIGNEFSQTKMVVKTCQCTENDFECDYNFVRGKSGKCELVPGMQSPRTECIDGKQEYFNISNGYRKIPQSTCTGGINLARPKEVWCPGKAQSIALFWTIFFPILFAAIAYVGFMLWKRYYRQPYGQLGVPSRSRFIAESPVFGRAKATARAASMAVSEFTMESFDKISPYLPQFIQKWLQNDRRYGFLGLPPTLDELDDEDIDDDGLDPAGQPHRRPGISSRAARARYAYQPLDANAIASRVFSTTSLAQTDDGVDDSADHQALFLDEVTSNRSSTDNAGGGEAGSSNNGQPKDWSMDNKYANLDASSSDDDNDISQR
ncbi:vacuolar protein sorting/targeting protein PEP1 [Mycoemilia scoparia]|uniref:Vacuolar protein sorting/targeting protein PEP1 n=1 Tax=Mycoemilia scoparia TaxID=417184 RepID=A0A9W8A6Z0_9FUNG|nr:vacuolar protein sorting/targeting protein PEP1 [Mycoemilia scoparia]